MEEYLSRYCRYISKLKNGVNISETLDFIKNDSTDTIEIIETFKNRINIDMICNLLKDEKFLIDYEYHDKVKLFFSFFYNLYAYAKNLILHFDIYQCKIIKPSYVTMRDCIMLFPDYRHYLESLLGYEYNEAQREWKMRLLDNHSIRNRLATVCILTAIGHGRIEKIVNERSSTSGDSSSSGSVSETFDENVDPSSTKWSCPSCSFLNDSTQANCTSCFHASKQSQLVKKNEATRARKQPNVSDCRDRNKGNLWKCGYCNTLNDRQEEKCKVCEGGHRALREAKRQRSREMGNSATDGRNVVVRRTVSGVKNGQDSWVCEQCTFVNVANCANCQACNTSRLKRASSHVQIGTERGPRADQWRCDKCTFINDSDNKRCEACSECRVTRTASTVQIRVNGNVVGRWKCERCSCVNEANCANCHACNTSRLKRASSHVQIGAERGPRADQWRCDKCTFINDSDNKRCEVCSECRLTRIASTVQNRVNGNVVGRWKCEQCSYVNKLDSAACVACEHLKVPTDKRGTRVTTDKQGTRVTTDKRGTRVPTDKQCLLDVRDTREDMVQSRESSNFHGREYKLEQGRTKSINTHTAMKQKPKANCKPNEGGRVDVSPTKEKNSKKQKKNGWKLFCGKKERD